MADKSKVKMNTLTRLTALVILELFLFSDFALPLSQINSTPNAHALVPSYMTNKGLSDETGRRDLIAITPSGKPLTSEEEIQVFQAIYGDFATYSAEDLELDENKLKELASEDTIRTIIIKYGVKVYIIPGLASCDEFLIAHPGRGGDVLQHKANHVYFSPKRLEFIKSLSSEAKEQFWKHEVLGHLVEFKKGASEEEIEKTYKTDLVRQEAQIAALKEQTAPQRAQLKQLLIYVAENHPAEFKLILEAWQAKRQVRLRNGEPLGYDDILLRYAQEALGQNWVPGPSTRDRQEVFEEVRGMFAEKIAAMEQAAPIAGRAAQAETTGLYLFNGKTREFELLLIALLFSQGSRNTVGALITSQGNVIDNQEILNLLFSKTNIKNIEELIEAVNLYAVTEGKIQQYLTDAVSFAMREHGKDCSETQQRILTALSEFSRLQAKATPPDRASAMKSPLGHQDIIEQTLERIARNEPVTVGFVCTANIFRSAAADILLQDRLSKLGVTNVTVQSAGLAVSQIGNEGQPLQPDLRQLLKKKGVEPAIIDSFNSQQLTVDFVKNCDLIVVASKKHLEVLTSFLLSVTPDALAKVVLFTDLHPELARFGDSFPDPAGREISTAELVELVDRTIVARFIEQLKQPVLSKAKTLPRQVSQATQMSKKLGGNRQGGQLEVKFTGEVWVKAGSWIFKAWVEENIVNFQRYDSKEGQVQGNLRQFNLDEVFQVGREREVGNTYLISSDTKLSGKHFKIKVSKAEGDIYKLSIQDLSSKNGTTVEWYEPVVLAVEATTENQEVIIKDNIAKIFSEEFYRVLWTESMGGNAGMGHAAVNGAIDASGRIVVFGNIQNLPEDIQEALYQGNLYDITIRVKTDRRIEGSDYEDYIDEKAPEKAKAVLRETIKEANSRSLTTQSVAEQPVRGVYSDLDSLERDISALEAGLQSIDIVKLPRIGFHGEEAGHEPVGKFWYFLLDANLEDYRRQQWRDDRIEAMFKLSAAKQAGNEIEVLAEMFMPLSEFFERLQGTIIFTSSYGKLNSSEGVLPEIYLLVEVPESNFQLRDKSADKEGSKVSAYDPKAGMKDYRLLFVEGNEDSQNVPKEAVVTKIGLTKEEFAAMAQWASRDRGETFGMSFFVNRLLYKKALENLISLSKSRPAAKSVQAKPGATPTPVAATPAFDFKVVKAAIEQDSEFTLPEGIEEAYGHGEERQRIEILKALMNQYVRAGSGEIINSLPEQIRAYYYNYVAGAAKELTKEAEIISRTAGELRENDSVIQEFLTTGYIPIGRLIRMQGDSYTTGRQKELIWSILGIRGYNESEIARIYGEFFTAVKAAPSSRSAAPAQALSTPVRVNFKNSSVTIDISDVENSPATFKMGNTEFQIIFKDGSFYFLCDAIENKEYELKERGEIPYTVGRAGSHNNIVIQKDGGVSKSHASLQVVNKQLILTDLNSYNGTEGEISVEEVCLIKAILAVLLAVKAAEGKPGLINNLVMSEALDVLMKKTGGALSSGEAADYLAAREEYDDARKIGADSHKETWFYKTLSILKANLSAEAELSKTKRALFNEYFNSPNSAMNTLGARHKLHLLRIFAARTPAAAFHLTEQPADSKSPLMGYALKENEGTMAVKELKTEEEAEPRTLITAEEVSEYYGADGIYATVEVKVGEDTINIRIANNIAEAKITTGVIQKMLQRQVDFLLGKDMPDADRQKLAERIKDKLPKILIVAADKLPNGALGGDCIENGLVLLSKGLSEIGNKDIDDDPARLAMADGTLYHEFSKHELTGQGDKAHTPENDNDDIDYLITTAKENGFENLQDFIGLLTDTLSGTKLYEILQLRAQTKVAQAPAALVVARSPESQAMYKNVEENTRVRRNLEQIKQAPQNLPANTVVEGSANTMASTVDLIHLAETADIELGIYVESIEGDYGEYLKDNLGLPKDMRIDVTQGRGEIKTIEDIRDVLSKEREGTRVIITDVLDEKAANELQGKIKKDEDLQEKLGTGKLVIIIRQQTQEEPFFISSIFQGKRPEGVITFTSKDAQGAITRQFDLDAFEKYRQQI